MMMTNNNKYKLSTDIIVTFHDKGVIVDKYSAGLYYKILYKDISTINLENYPSFVHIVINAVPDVKVVVEFSGKNYDDKDMFNPIVQKLKDKVSGTLGNNVDTHKELKDIIDNAIDNAILKLSLLPISGSQFREIQEKNVNEQKILP